MERYVPEPRRRSRLAAAFMAFAFGTFGVHKFYLNNQGAGVFYIMLFVMTINLFNFPVSFILGLIDAMKLLMMSEDEFDHKYNKKSVRTGQSYGRSKRRRPSQNPDFRRKTQEQRTTQRTQRTTQKRRTNKPNLRKENAYIKTGITKYKDFDLDDAIIDFNKGLEIDPQNVALHFNIACAYSLIEQKEKAFEHLSKAVAFGLKDVEKINTHEDLAFVRIQAEFENFKNNDFRMKANTTQGQEAPSNPQVEDELLNRLNKLAELRKRGLLSDKEFLMEKEKLMH